MFERKAKENSNKTMASPPEKLIVVLESWTDVNFDFCILFVLNRDTGMSISYTDLNEALR